MPINLTKLVSNRASADVDFGPDAGTLHVEFYPARLTTRMLADYSAADPAALAGAPPERVLAVLGSPTETLLTLLASWDLTTTAEDGVTEEPLPIDRETLESLGIQIQWTMLSAILSAQSGASGAQGKTDAADTPVSAPSSAAS